MITLLTNLKTDTELLLIYKVSISVLAFAQFDLVGFEN